MKEIMTYKEMKNMFCEYEKTFHFEHLTGYIIFATLFFANESFTKNYPLGSRTYKVSSDNKAFQPNMSGYSIYGSSIDGSDKGVRLEQYMADEYGGKDGWVVESCYVIKSDLITNEDTVEQFRRKARVIEDKYKEWVDKYTGKTDDRRIVVSSVKVLLEACKSMESVTNTAIKCAFHEYAQSVENQCDRVIRKFDGMIWNHCKCQWVKADN